MTDDEAAGLGLGPETPRWPQEEVKPEQIPVEIDPAQVQVALEQLRSHQNLLGGVLAGLVAAGIGAGVWAGVTVITNFQIGLMAVGVGFLVGFAVRSVGKGVDPVFGVVGATLALLGCAVGNLLTVSAIFARQEGMALMEMLSLLDLAIAWKLMAVTFSPIDLLFYGIAVYEGYKLSFRQVSLEELGFQPTGH